METPSVPVISPEIVGVAVQEFPVTVKFPPKEVKLLPETVNVLSSVVAPCRVNAPGVPVEPIVFVDEAPLPKVLVEAPVPNVVDPLEVKVENAPVEGVPAPIVVPFIVPPVAVNVPAVIAFEAPDNVSVFEYVPESPADNKTPVAFSIGVPPTFNMFPKVPVVDIAFVTVPAP